MESVPEALRKDWLDRSLNLRCDWIFLHAIARHAVVLDMVLSDIPIDRNCDVLPIVEYSIETDNRQTLN